MTNEMIWQNMTDEQRRAVLDQFTMTSDIPSDIKWDHLDHGTRSAIIFTGTVEGMK
jgi:hypothetical protein